MSYTVSLVNAHPGGMKPRVYYLRLLWTDSIDPNSASVNIYRGLVSGGPYTLINNVAMGVQLYDDFAVSPQTTYFYVVTELDNLNNESPFSAEQMGTAGWIA